MNTLGGLLAGEDYTDPYFSSSAELRYSWAVGSTGTLRLGGGVGAPSVRRERGR